VKPETIPKNNINDVIEKRLFLTNISLKIKLMNLKRLFGAILTALGIGGLIYTAILFANTSGENKDIKSLIIYGVLGLVFFFSGISLVKTTKDES
jgi:hypothetical protein